MKSRFGAIAFVCFLTSGVLADHHESATAEDFALMGKMHQGRWVGDVKFIADWPGETLGEGSNVVSYAEYKWTLDEKVLERIENVGNSQVKQIFFYDAPGKKIRFAWVNSSGACLYGHLWKTSDTSFGWRITGGGLSDGRAETGTGEVVFSNEGNTCAIKGQVKLDGKDLAKLNDVYKRLSP